MPSPSAPESEGSMLPPPSTSSPIELPALPLIVPDSKTDYTPRRKIFSDTDLPNWLDSEAYYYIELIIARLSVAVDGKKVEDPCPESPAVKVCVRFLEDLTARVDDITLDPSPQRFGNKAFRDWIALMEKEEAPFQKSLLSPAQFPIFPELSQQFRTSFGSGPRIDYGTGHELAFLAYLLILRLVGVFSEQDEQAIVTRIFVAYLVLVRKLQKVFKLEPAGSKGVWGLDDHQHLVYLWGASQLRTHPTLRPATILSPSSISPQGISYLFLSSILHVNDLKSGPFAEHSPMLHNIATTVPNWAKVNTGLTKMYRAEVLEKVPVVQHFRFGGILAWRRKDSGEVMPSTGDHLDDVQVTAEATLDVHRVRDEGTVAPWALPTLSGIEPPPLVTDPLLLPSPSSPRGSPVPLARKASTPPSPKPWTPPALFPIERRRSRLSVSSREEGLGGLGAAGAEDGTVRGEGGAAAGSSPFGALPAAMFSSEPGAMQSSKWLAEDVDGN